MEWKSILRQLGDWLGWTHWVVTFFFPWYLLAVGGGAEAAQSDAGVGRRGAPQAPPLGVEEDGQAEQAGQRGAADQRVHLKSIRFFRQKKFEKENILKMNPSTASYLVLPFT